MSSLPLTPVARLLPRSPRRRRRVAWAAVALAALGGFAVVAAALPGSPPSDVAAPTSQAGGQDAPAFTPPQPKPVALTTAERKAIGGLLARFVPWAIARERPAAAYSLVTPALRVAATKKEWRSGTIPVVPYPADPRRSRGWTLNYAFPRRANLDLLLMPKAGVRRGPLAVNLELVERRGEWLVDAVVPVAVFSPPGKAPRIIAQPDLGPMMPDGDEGRLNPAWLLLLPAALLALPFVAVGVHSLRRPRPRR